MRIVTTMSDSSDDNKHEEYALVVAIDFGTAFSGYAMSFKESPEEIITNGNWGEDLGFQVKYINHIISSYYTHFQQPYHGRHEGEGGECPSHLEFENGDVVVPL